MLMSCVAFSFVACTAASSGGGGGYASPDAAQADAVAAQADSVATKGGVPLQIYEGYNLAAFVDSQGAYSNVQHIRLAAFGGSPDPAKGYAWTYSLGDGLPATITIDPTTGLLQGTIPSSFTRGAPGIADGASTIYPLTITVSDGVSSVSSASCHVLDASKSASCASSTGAADIRLFVSGCDSVAMLAYCGSDGVSGKPYPQGPPYLGSGQNDSSGTATGPDDIVSEMNVTGIHVNRPFGYALPFQGGTPPYNFKITAGALPPGLSLTADSGEILGTPTAAAVGNTYGFAVHITDGVGNTSRDYYYTFNKFVL